MPQKKRKVSVKEQVTNAVAVVEPWMACEDVGSDYVKSGWNIVGRSAQQSVK